MPRAVQPTPTATTQQTRFFLGTSGWAYPTWKPAFYPEGTPTKRLLQAYAERLTSVEVNYTFTKLPTAAQMQGWLDAVPAGFRFSFKAPQRITHFQRLAESAETLKEFLDALKPAQKAGKLGAVLFQLPPNFKANHERLAAFLRLPALSKSKMPVAFEFRHASWFAEQTYSLLRKRGVALCIAESDDLETPDVATAGFAYLRMRKNGGYSEAQLKAMAARFANLQTCDAYVYFKHEDEPTGALNAVHLRKNLGKVTGVQA